jgi:hypothetical protein
MEILQLFYVNKLCAQNEFPTLPMRFVSSLRNEPIFQTLLHSQKKSYVVGKKTKINKLIAVIAIYNILFAWTRNTHLVSVSRLFTMRRRN